jgi:hypothetical protein
MAGSRLAEMRRSCRWSFEDSGSRRILQAAAYIYWAVSVPVRVAFLPDFVVGVDYLAISIVDFLVNVLCLVEGILKVPKFGCSAIMPIHDVQVTSTKSQRRRSGRGRLKDEEKEVWWNRRLSEIWPHSTLIAFWVAIAPIEYVARAVNLRQHSMFLVNRIGLLFFLPSCIMGIAKELEKRRILTNIGLQRTWQLFFLMALAGHWCGCIFFGVAKREALVGNEFTWPQNAGLWTVAINEEGHASVLMATPTATAYLHSLYWAYITMVRV